MIHHGDQEIQEDDDVNNWISAEHQHAPESGEYLDAVQFKAVEIHQAENRPKERLYRLKQTTRKIHILYYPKWIVRVIAHKRRQSEKKKIYNAE